MEDHFAFTVTDLLRLCHYWFANIHILRVAKDSAIKMGSLAVLGWSFLETPHFEVLKWGYPFDFFSRSFWLNIFLKSLFEKSNTFQQLLNTYFRAFSDLLSCGPLGPLPIPG